MPIELELAERVEATAGRAEPDADKEAKKDAAADALTPSGRTAARDGSTPVHDPIDEAGRDRCPICLARRGTTGRHVHDGEQRGCRGQQ